MYHAHLGGAVQLTLVGTGHVFAIGHLVEGLIDTRRPDIVCVELDPTRLRGLQERKRLNEMEAAGDPRVEDIKRQQAEAVKRLPLAYRMLAKMQDDIATGEGVQAGSEMLAAVEAANRRGIPAACIDVDAQALVRRAWREMGLFERVRFLWSLWRGKGGGTMEKELEQYQDDPVAYLAMVGNDFPTLKRVLIDERDAHMASGILRIHEQKDQVPNAGDPLRVLAVVGDGHVAGMLGHLRAHFTAEELDIVRVKDLRAGTVPANPFPNRATDAAPHGDAQVSFDVHVPSDQPE